MAVKIWYSPYELKALSSLNRSEVQVQKGFLLRIQTDEFEYGYADCCPHKIFNDGGVETQLAALKQNQWTHLLKRSLFFANEDGRAREQKTSLLSETKVKSHYTCTDISQLKESLGEIQQQGFTTIKVKAGRDIPTDVKHFIDIGLDRIREFQWRIDFNGFGGKAFLSALPQDDFDYIDFVEDPEAYDLDEWLEIEDQFKVKTALDQASEKEVNHDICIIKPSRQSQLARTQDVITNSMDHPVGQTFAYWFAQSTVERLGLQGADYGLCTQHLFAPNLFSPQLSQHGPYFHVERGYGIGFDKILQQQIWLEI